MGKKLCTNILMNASLECKALSPMTTFTIAWKNITTYIKAWKIFTLWKISLFEQRVHWNTIHLYKIEIILVYLPGFLKTILLGWGDWAGVLRALFCRSELNYLQSRQYKNHECQESFFSLPSLPFLLLSLSCGFEAVWSHKNLVSVSFRWKRANLQEPPLKNPARYTFHTFKH